MKLFGLLIGAIALAACGGADTKDVFGTKVCVAGTTIECACPGGAKGAQACRDDGTGYETCQCGGGSGGSAGAGQSGSSGAGGSTGGSAGSGGAGGSCTPRTMCPEAPDGSAALCGMLDDYCGGTLSCGCEFGACAGGACECKRISGSDALCAAHYPQTPIAMGCAPTSGVPMGCLRAGGGWGFPADSLCCAH